MNITCEQCGTAAPDNSPAKGKRYCSDRCRMAAHLDRQFLQRLAAMDEDELREAVRVTWDKKPYGRLRIRYGS